MRSARFLMGCSVLCLAIAGCGRQEAPPTAQSEASSQSTEDHGHSHDDAPHGGTVVDWGGGEYHAEFTVDHEKKEATVYILGSDAKSPAPVKTESVRLIINDPETELELTAQPQEGDPEGSSSRFVGTHDTIGIVKEFEGTISGEVGGTPYVGEFREVPHGEDHKH
jgi:hypothetical protein